MVINADEITVIRLERHGHTRVFNIRLDKGAGPFVAFQIAPEKPLADGHLIGGETPQGDVYCLLKDIRVYGFLQNNGKPIDGGKVLALQGGINDG